jgi:hypothetical protein
VTISNAQHTSVHCEKAASGELQLQWPIIKILVILILEKFQNFGFKFKSFFLAHA